MNQGVGDSINDNVDSAIVVTSQTDAPEKQLTHFALRLALLEKTATGLGTLGFIWATVVLLGGFAITLDTTDFWFITIILLIEGTRIFSRSHELEWQHQATIWSNPDDNQVFRSPSSNFIRTLRPLFGSPRTNEASGRRASDNDEEDQAPTRRPFVPQWSLLSRNISKLLYWLQLFSATTCIVLSLINLIKHNFGVIQEGDADKRNRKAALIIFYSLALAEALLFLMEKVYWEWKAGFCKLLEKVNDTYELGPSGMVSTQRFLYDAYSRSITGSVFDSLKMDMVSFAVELLTSYSPDEQLIGARLLRQFATNARFSNATLRSIGVNITVIERLVEMLNWRNPNEHEIRESAAEILAQVASQKQNSLRIAEIPGAVESVASLLWTNRRSYTSAGDEICQRGNMSDCENEDVQKLNYLGLQILNELSRDHDNCGKIGNTRGLLPKIVDFIYTSEETFSNPRVIDIVKQSLELVKMLASTTGVTGNSLRREISEIVFSISNVRNILKQGNNYPALQLLSIEVLTNLGMEDDATEKIGGTGGVLKELLNIFFQPGKKEQLIKAAGDAISMLTLESKNNCLRVLKLEAMEKLVEALESEEHRISAARILRNLCTYTEDAGSKDTLHRVVATAPTVLKAIIMPESNKQQEVMIGLALYAFKYMTSEDFSNMLQKEEVTEASLAEALVKILKQRPKPSIKVPRIRRFAIELAIWMMSEKEGNIDNFRKLELKEELKRVTETTTEIENFQLFSGTVGVSRHGISLNSLINAALDILD